MRFRFWPVVTWLLLSLTTLVSAAFLPRTKAERSEALGDLTEVRPELRVLLTPENDFDLIPRPESGDWLESHIEPGQSFKRYLEGKPNQVDAERRYIYLQPIGDFSPGSSPSLDVLKRYASIFFQMEVKVLPPCQLKAMAFSPRVNPGTKQVQLLTRPVLDFLAKRLPADAFCVLGITMQDLYPDPSWNYVFGQASLTKRVGVYSFARYDAEFFGDSRPDNWKNLMLRRSCKVLGHETGHMFGLWHCIYYDCAMNGSNNLEEADKRTVELCPICLRKLQYGAKFEPVKRYRELAAFYREMGWTDDATWCDEQVAKVP